MLVDILFFIVAFVSEVIGAIAGFGSSTICLPLALFFVDFQTALILVAISLLFVVRPALRVPTNKNIVITGGGISGLITGLVGTGGALRASFLTGFNLEKTKYIATAAVIALGTDVTRIPVYLSQGFLLQQYYYYIPILAATAIGGSYVGKKIAGKIDQSRFRKIVLVAIIIVSINFIISGSL